ncbi:MAG: TIGR03545 family protein [Leptospirillia bacterium]
MLGMLVRLMRVLGREVAPGQIALGAAFGLVTGLTPLFSLHNLLVLVLALLLRANLSVFLAVTAAGSGVAYLLDPLFHAIGFALLTAGTLEGLWTALYNLPLARLAHFNNSVVMGSLVVSLLLFFPVARWGGVLVVRYREDVLDRVRRLKVVQALKAGRLAASAGGAPVSGGGLRPFGALLACGAVLLLCVFVLLFAGKLVEWGVEEGGTRLVGARVDVGDADFSLWSGSLSLTDLAVTNPSAPMTNALEAGHIAVALDSGGLISRKVVINRMEVERVRLGTPRVSSGAISRVPKVSAPATGDSDGFSLPGFEVPGVKQLLAGKSLDAVADAERLAADLKSAEEEWAERMKKLPDQGKLASYRERAEALGDKAGGGIGGLLGAGREVQELKRDLQADMSALTGARDDLKKELADYRERAQKVARAPAEEARRIAATVSGEGAAGNIGSALFGDAAGGWIKAGADWYRRLSPLLDRVAAGRGEPQAAPPLRGKGVDVRFPESDPLPDFLLREADVSVQLERFGVSGWLRDISSDPARLGRPATFGFKGDGLADGERLEVSGRLDHTDPERPVDALKLNLSGVPLTGFPLSRSASFPVSLAKADAALDVDVKVAAEALSGEFTARLEGARFTVGETGNKAISEALSRVRQVTVRGAISGTVASPEMRLGSDLDRVLGDAVKSAAKGRLAALEKDLETEIAGRVGQRLEGSGDILSRLDSGVGGVLAERLGAGEGVLAEAFKSKSGLKLPF